MSPETVNDWIPEKEVPEHYPIPLRTVQNKRRAGQFAPHARVGRTIMYSLSTLNSWLSGRESVDDR